MIKADKIIQRSSVEFNRLRGNESLKLLLSLITIDPTLGGLIIFGHTGTGKSEFLRSFQNIKLPIQTIFNCPYHCSPSQGNLCSSCKRVIQNKTELNLQFVDTPIKKLPSTAPIEAIVGSLNFNLEFRSGILGHVNNGYLLIDDFHLVPRNSLNVIIDAWENQLNVVQRSSISVSHPSKFCLIASARANHHQISPAILDKFAFSYFIHYDNSIQERMDIININIEDHRGKLIDKFPASNHFSENFLLAIKNAKNNLSLISISKGKLSYIAQLCAKTEVQGQRADITLAKGARALASFLNKEEVTKEDIDLIAPFVLGHRITEEKKEILLDSLVNEHDSQKNENIQKSKIKKESKQIPLKRNSVKKVRERISKVGNSLALFFCLVLCLLILINLFANPDVLTVLISSIIVIGIWILILYRALRKRQEIMEQYGIKQNYDNIKPNLDSFSNVKEFRISAKTREEKKKANKDIILDIEEDYSRLGKIKRFIGLQRRRGMISLTDRQKYWLNLLGISILVIYLVFFYFLLFFLPVEFFASIILFISCLSMIGYVIQALRKQYRVRRVADIGASPNETSRSLGVKGIGSHTSFQDQSKNKERSSFQEYEENLANRLVDLDVIPNQTEKQMGIHLFQKKSSKELDKPSFKVKTDFLPTINRNMDSKHRTNVGKRALSISSVSSGRVIGSQSYKDFPKNIHIMATIYNSILRQFRRGRRKYELPLSVELDDIREKVFHARVSATIIFVLDLSESISSAINAVSASVTWLSRQAYLYRDRVGVVAMKGTQGIVIQTPTSNLNLIKRKIQKLRVSGSTPLAGGLQKAIDLIKIDRIQNKNETIPMIILITDGAANIPLITDPKTKITRKTPLKKLGINRAVKMAIKDCLYMAQLIKREKISLTIFTTNLEAKESFQVDMQTGKLSSSKKLEVLLYENNLVRTRRFISLWSSMLLQAIQEITHGHLFYISRYRPQLNLETLRVARAEILSILNK
jgi:magnesium chelatase subunit I